jgi:hypothetical protein
MPLTTLEYITPSLKLWNSFPQDGWQVPVDVLSHLERYVNWCIYSKLIEVRNFIPNKFASLKQEKSPDFNEFKELLAAPEGFNLVGRSWYLQNAWKDPKLVSSETLQCGHHTEDQPYALTHASIY